MTCFWDDLAQHAPIATALFALIALLVAAVSILVQRSTAKKRAAIDFFLKTEMDDKMIDAHRRSRPGFLNLRAGMPIATFVSSADYDPVRRYLNVHELMAVGVEEKVFDEDVCYRFWSGELIEDYRNARSLIDFIRENPSEGTPETYADMEALAKKWRARLDR